MGRPRSTDIRGCYRPAREQPQRAADAAAPATHRAARPADRVAGSSSCSRPSAAVRRLYQFFEFTSLSIRMSSAWSSPMFFSSLFTRSSCFRRWSDSAPSRRICSSCGKKVPLLMPCARSTSGSGLPFRLPSGCRESDSQSYAHSWSLEWLFTQGLSLKPLRVHVRRTRGNLGTHFAMYLWRQYVSS